MPNPKNNLISILFLVGLLFCANLVRSGVLVDTSFLPRFLSLALVLLFAFLLLFRNKAIFPLNFWTLSLTGFYVWNLISCLWATSVSEAVMQSQLVFMGVAVFFIVSAFNKENKGFEDNFIRVHLLVLLFSFVLAFYKINTLKYYDPYKISSISLNNNLYSGFLLLSLPVILTAYSLFKGAWKYISVFTGILALFFIIIVQTRAAYMGLTFALLVTSVLVLARYRRVFSKRNILTAFLALIILMAGVFLFYSSLDATRRNAFHSKVTVWNYFIRQKPDVKTEIKLAETTTLDSKPITPSAEIPVEYYDNVNTRLIFWKKSLGLINAHPVSGVGAGNWRILIASVSEPPNPEHTIRNYTYSQPHNEWIGILSELGIVGFLLAAMVFFVPIIFILFKVLFGKSKPPVSVVLYAGFLAGFYMYASFDFPLRRVEHLVLLFSILAFLFAKMPVAKEYNLQNSLFRRISPFVFTALLLFTLVVAVERIKGEYYTLKVFRNEKRNDKAVVRYCKEARNRFYAVSPNAMPVDWFAGVAHYRLGDNDSALSSFESALQSTPYEVRVLNDYGAVLYALGKQDKAVGVLKNCFRIDPYFDEAKFNLAAIYFSMPKPDSALYFVNLCRDSQKKKDYLNELKGDAKQ
jgi:hypothetical protein